MGYENFKGKVNTKIESEKDKIEFIVAEGIGNTCEDGKTYVEVAVGHYEKNGKATGDDRIYLSSKASKDDRTYKALGMSFEQAKEVCEFLTQFFNS